MGVKETFERSLSIHPKVQIAGGADAHATT
jgi:hypothetical protein